MSIVEDWRHAVRWKIDGPRYGYDGVGEHSALHAMIIQKYYNGKRLWRVEVMCEVTGDQAEAYTYGDNLPLTFRMATEIAERFVTGKKIPRRLEWR